MRLGKAFGMRSGLAFGMRLGMTLAAAGLDVTIGWPLAFAVTLSSACCFCCCRRVLLLESLVLLSERAGGATVGGVGSRGLVLETPSSGVALLRSVE